MISEEKKKIRMVNKTLIKFYGIPERPEVPPDPVDMLIGTILSQNTNDRNSYKAFMNLKNEFSSWEKAAGISRRRIESLIRIAGLGKQKSFAIKNFLSSAIAAHGRVTLDHLKNLSNEDIFKELTIFPGVGIKTASCVLLFSLRRNVCPVDTHVHRTVNRIGIIKAGSPDKSFELLNKTIPDGVAHQFHTNLIRLGREICKPAKPGCSICPLIKLCDYKEKNLVEVREYKVNDFLLLDRIK
jgi:endonuclease-3